jgi:acyl carrier protein
MSHEPVPKSILDILTEIRPESDFASSDNYLEDGLLDSMDITQFVAAAEEKWSICIKGTDILAENFQNGNAIATLLSSYGVAP